MRSCGATTAAVLQSVLFPKYVYSYYTATRSTFHQQHHHHHHHPHCTITHTTSAPHKPLIYPASTCPHRRKAWYLKPSTAPMCITWSLNIAPALYISTRRIRQTRRASPMFARSTCFSGRRMGRACWVYFKHPVLLQFICLLVALATSKVISTQVLTCESVCMMGGLCHFCGTGCSRSAAMQPH